MIHRGGASAAKAGLTTEFALKTVAPACGVIIANLMFLAPMQAVLGLTLIRPFGGPGVQIVALAFRRFRAIPGAEIPAARSGITHLLLVAGRQGSGPSVAQSGGMWAWAQQSDLT